MFLYVHVLTTTYHIPCTKVSRAVHVPVSVFGWLLGLMPHMHTPLPAAPSGPCSLLSPWFIRPGALHLQPPTLPTLTPSVFPPISWSRDSPVSHLGRSHCHSLASRRWLRDGASRCNVGNHFDRARGYQQRVSIFHICQCQVLSRAFTEMNPERVKGNYRVNRSQGYDGSLTDQRQKQQPWSCCKTVVVIININVRCGGHVFKET